MKIVQTHNAEADLDSRGILRAFKFLKLMRYMAKISVYPVTSTAPVLQLNNI